MVICKIFEEKNLDAILITNLSNLRYFTGFTGSTGVALILKEVKFFFADFRYIEQAKKQSEPRGYTVVGVERDVTSKMAEYIKNSGIKRLGIEDLHVSVARYKAYKEKFGDIAIVDLGDSLLKCRMVKLGKELDCIKKAAEIADEAFAKILPKIKEGVSEKELANELEYEMKKLGADDKAFDTIVASNYRSAMPHGVASDKVIEKEGFIKFDFGCFYKGYASDITRTVYLGENISDKHLEIYNTVLDAQKLALSKIKAGMKVNEVDKIARDYITQKGYGKNFGHGLGHGIGLEIHEYPYLSSNVEDMVLEENMVVTVEPGIYIEGFGGVRIEDDVIIKKDGCEIINKTPKELLIIK